ncbi:hypothetical protein [Hoeflea sp.]|uniref:hypothetical protein n=1 Tax=Hoeflea sp. TaxID=1940281 RepID=UPI003B01ED3F
MNASQENMPFELRLYEDTPFAGDEVHYSEAVPRALYVSAGSIRVNGTEYPEDEGLVSTDPLSVHAGSNGATIWRWEVASSTVPRITNGSRSTLRLWGGINPSLIADELLIRLDSVAFPPEGTALLHTHQGPGIRCLREGSIRIDTEGSTASYCPGGAWFEGGPEPVFAQAATDRPSRFIRAMVLPQSLLGASSIRYVNDEDRGKRKSQSYRVFCETSISLNRGAGQ